MTTLIYLPGLTGDFVIDDRTYFTDNDILPALDPWQVERVLCEPSNYWGEHLPIRDLLFVWEYSLFGDDTLGYHCVSLFLYLLCGVLLFRLATEFYGRIYGANRGARACTAALIVTGLFLFHPAHVESVAYISGQKDLLFMLFSLALLRLFHSAYAANRLGDWKIVSVCALLYYLGVLARPTAVATGLLIGILLGYIYRRNLREAIVAVVVWGALNVPALLALRHSLAASRSFQGAPSPLLDVSLVQRVFRALRILGEQTLLTVRPWPRNFGYPFDPNPSADLGFWIGVFVLVVFLFSLISKRSRLLPLGLLIFLVFLFPALQLFVPLRNASIYDRYVSMALLGPIVIVEAACTMAASAHRKLAIAPLLVFAILAVVFCTATVRYVPTFKDDVAQTAHAHSLYPDWPSAPFNHVYALVEDGQLQRALYLTQREESFGRPPWVRGFFRGWIELEQGHVDAAIRTLSTAAYQVRQGGFQAFPNIPLGDALIRKGRREAAIEILRYALDAPIYNPLEYYRARRLLEDLGVDPGPRARFSESGRSR